MIGTDGGKGGEKGAFGGIVFDFGEVGRFASDGRLDSFGLHKGASDGLFFTRFNIGIGGSDFASPGIVLGVKCGGRAVASHGFADLFHFNHELMDGLIHLIGGDSHRNHIANF